MSTGIKNQISLTFNIDDLKINDQALINISYKFAAPIISKINSQQNRLEEIEKHAKEYGSELM